MQLHWDNSLISVYTCITYSVAVQNSRTCCALFFFLSEIVLNTRVCIILRDPFITLSLKAVFDTWVGRALWGCFVPSCLLGFRAVSPRKAYPFPVTTGLIIVCLHSSAVSSHLLLLPCHIGWAFLVSSLFVFLYVAFMPLELRWVISSTLIFFYSFQTVSISFVVLINIFLWSCSIISVAISCVLSPQCYV